MDIQHYFTKKSNISENNTETDKKKSPPILYTDGASRGNPGPSSVGIAFFSQEPSTFHHKPEWTVSKFIGHATNNVAEYQAVLLGFTECLQRRIKTVELRSDSQLLIRQLEGKYQVKSPALKHLFDDIQTLRSQFEKVILTHVRGHQGIYGNEIADQLANLALDNKSEEKT